MNWIIIPILVVFERFVCVCGDKNRTNVNTFEVFILVEL